MADIAQDPSLPQKKQARRRLVGAAVLCLALGISLPFIFDPEPKKTTKVIEETPVNVAVVKPSGESSVPASPVAPVAPVAPTAPVAAPSVEAPAQPVITPGPEIAAPVPPVVAPTKEATKPPDLPKTAEVKKPVEAKKPATTVTELISQGDQAKTKPKPAAAADKPKSEGKEGKYLVQIGAFGSASGADEQVKRASALGLKAFTEKVSTNAGSRIRVRLGPFGSREQAEKARESLKAAGIESALIAP
jgi:DedD protein